MASKLALLAKMADFKGKYWLVIFWQYVHFQGLALLENVRFNVMMAVLFCTSAYVRTYMHFEYIIFLLEQKSSFEIESLS